MIFSSSRASSQGFLLLIYTCTNDARLCRRFFRATPDEGVAMQAVHKTARDLKTWCAREGPLCRGRETSWSRVLVLCPAGGVRRHVLQVEGVCAPKAFIIVLRDPLPRSFFLESYQLLKVCLLLPRRPVLMPFAPSKLQPKSAALRDPQARKEVERRLKDLSRQGMFITEAAKELDAILSERGRASS